MHKLRSNRAHCSVDISKHHQRANSRFSQSPLRVANSLHGANTRHENDRSRHLRAPSERWTSAAVLSRLQVAASSSQVHICKVACLGVSRATCCRCPNPVSKALGHLHLTVKAWSNLGLGGQPILQLFGFSNKVWQLSNHGPQALCRLPLQQKVLANA